MVASSQNKPGRACGLGAFAVVLALVAAACESPPETVPSAPGLASDFLDRGLAYQEMGKYDQAIQDYSEAIRLRPDYAIAFNNRGNTYYRKRVYDQAMNDLSEAIRLKPDYALAYNNRGLAYWKMGQLDRAIEDFDEAIHLGTLEGDRKAWPYNNRGLVYYSRAEYRRAIRDFDQAIHINPNDTNALTNRSKANRRQGRFDEAIRDAGEAIRLGTLKKRQLARAYRIRGAAYAAKGEYDRAILEHNKAMAADPTYAGSYQNRGYALFFMEKFDEAVGEFRRSVSLDPDFSYGVIFY
jgi:tetratricopeptide (TPR) repeat protein